MDELTSLETWLTRSGAGEDEPLEWAELLADQLYVSTLHRESDAQGRRLLASRLRTGMSNADAIRLLEQSDEGRSIRLPTRRIHDLVGNFEALVAAIDVPGREIDMEPFIDITACYVAILSRLPDAVGFAKYYSDRRSGRSVRDIANDLARSDEATSRFGPLYEHVDSDAITQQVIAVIPSVMILSQIVRLAGELRSDRQSSELRDAVVRVEQKLDRIATVLGASIRQLEVNLQR